MKQEIIDKINRLASQDEPFLFVINYQGDKAFIRRLSDINPEECLFDFEGRGNSSDEMKNNSEKIAEISWQIAPPLYEDYERSFGIVKNNIMAGNSYLTNLTCKVPVSCNLSLEDIFNQAKGKYKLLLRRKRNQAEDKAQQKEEESQNKADKMEEEFQNKTYPKEENIEEISNPFVCFSPETFVRIKNGRKRNQAEDKAQQKEEESQNKADKMEEEFQNKTYPKEENIEEISNPFVCFSPETFVRIKNGRIYSYPMKGTLDASLPDAERLLMEDEKEAAEHATIVDLIRNDLSRVAENVRVDKYRYIDILHTNKGDILQTSSEISGRLPEDYQEHLGEILDAQLPAGSITGAPKDKTMQIIHEAEGYDRGFYTGIMGIYDQGELNSAVMIRFVEEEASSVDFEADGEKNFKTGGGKEPKASRELYFKAGGGITSKSDCRKEYEEVIQKIYLPIQENPSSDSRKSIFRILGNRLHKKLWEL